MQLISFFLYFCVLIIFGFYYVGKLLFLVLFEFIILFKSFTFAVQGKWEFSCCLVVYFNDDTTILSFNDGTVHLCRFCDINFNIRMALKIKGEIFKYRNFLVKIPKLFDHKILLIIKGFESKARSQFLEHWKLEFFSFIIHVHKFLSNNLNNYDKIFT